MNYLENFKLENQFHDFYFDFKTFSHEKNLFDYQQTALKNTVKYISNYCNQHTSVDKPTNMRKWDALKDYLFEDEKDTKSINDEKKSIQFNMLSYWMATGSGKTLVIVKLIELLKRLEDDGYLTKKRDIIFLTEREDLLKQFKETILEFNLGNKSKYKIHLESLKNHEAYKINPSPKFTNKYEITVYYYKSNSLTEDVNVSYKGDKENKERIAYEKLLDRDITIILDEAHKGTSSEDSKRFKRFFGITKNGYLFNFSATLTDNNQKRMSLLKFDVTEYIKAGYGKKLQIISKPIKGYNEKEYSPYDLGELEQKEIVKAFILLTYLKKSYEKLKTTDIYKVHGYKYHNPMMVILTNSVNSLDSDLKHVFNSIFNDLTLKIINKAKADIIDVLKESKTILPGNNEKFNLDEGMLESISIEDIHKYVYNRIGSSSRFEYQNTNNKELVFKYNNTDENFALIKIGDTKTFSQNVILKEHGISQSESLIHKNEFDDLENSSINILMGSRAFYEGWDSLRPNIMLYINIGSKTAEKFVLQSLGRGLRLSPNGKDRKRLEKIENNHLINTTKEINALETLFVLSTKPNDIKKIISSIEANTKQEDKVNLKVYKNNKPNNMPLYKPTYTNHEELYKDQHNLKDIPKIKLNQDDTNYIKNLFLNKNLNEIYLEYYYIDKLNIESLVFIQNNIDELINSQSQSSYKNQAIIFERIFANVIIKLQKLSEFKLLVETGDNKDISHYENIEISKSLYIKLRDRIDEFLNTQMLENINPKQMQKELGKRKYEQVIQDQSMQIEYKDKDFKVMISKTDTHYYKPTIYSDKYDANIKNIINVKSEYDFLNLLFEKIDEEEIDTTNLFFSRIKEKQDNIYIPYTKNGRLHKFYPDFIFWKIKDNGTYSMLFVDPKGIAKSNDYMDKLDGFTKYVKEYEKSLGTDISIDLVLYNDGDVQAGSAYKHYVKNNNEIIKLIKNL